MARWPVKLRLGRLRIGLGANAHRSPYHEAAIAIGWSSSTTNGALVQIGWSADPEVPIRPWPKAWRSTTAKGRVIRGISLLGFFVSICFYGGA